MLYQLETNLNDIGCRLVIEKSANAGTVTAVTVDGNLPKVIPADNYMFKVNNRNTRTRCDICSK